MTINRSGKIIVIGLVHIISVIYVDKSGMITVVSPWVIVHIHASKTVYPSIVITNIDIPDPIYPTIIIIIDRNVLYLNYGTVVVILNIGIVVVTRIEGDLCVSKIHIGIPADPIVNIEIEFPIGIN